MSVGNGEWARLVLICPILHAARVSYFSVSVINVKISVIHNFSLSVVCI